MRPLYVRRLAVVALVLAVPVLGTPAMVGRSSGAAALTSGRETPAADTDASASALTQASAKRLKVAILGDSYSAGNGSRFEKEGEKPRTSYRGPNGCYRSRDNWGTKYARGLLGARSRIYACSGATTGNIHGRNAAGKYPGRVSPAPDGVRSEEEILAWARESDWCNAKYNNYPEHVEFDPIGPAKYSFGRGSWITFKCERFLKPQADFVDETTDLVLMTIGGNDLEFSEIVKRCFGPVAPFWGRNTGECITLVENAKRLTPDLSKTIASTIEGLYTRPGGLRPDAKVVLVGYPLLALADVPFNVGGYHAAVEVRRLGLQGNAALIDTVEAVNAGVTPAAGNVTFVNGIPGLFADHEPDPRFFHHNPSRWLWEIGDNGTSLPTDYTQTLFEWYHPNPHGHKEYARHLYEYPGGSAAFGAGANRKPAGDVDVVFVVDTSDSMSAELKSLKAQLRGVMTTTRDRANTSRFALVSYREDPRYSGDPVDYLSRVERAFTTDPSAVASAADGLSAAGGGGDRETMWSGVKTAVDLPWRTDVKKQVIVITDNGAHNPEPFTGLDDAAIATAAWNVDPASVTVIDSGIGVSRAPVRRVVNATAGVLTEAPNEADLGPALDTAIAHMLDRPDPWLDGPYVARVGDELEIDGSGSYATDESGLASYEWDIDGDRTFDLTTALPSITHTWDSEMAGEIGLRVTDASGRSSLTTARINITRDADEIPTEYDNCPDDPNMDQEDTDDDGIGDYCDPTPGWTVGGELVELTPSRLEGVPRPGNVLRAVPGTWSEPTTARYQWMVDGQSVVGATSDSFVVDSSHVRRKVSVRITTTVDNGGETVKVETHDVVGEPQPLTNLTPSGIDGRPRPGHTLTAIPGTWSGRTTPHYQWQRDGQPIPGATAQSYALTKADIRHRVRVVITTSSDEFGEIAKETHGAYIGRYLSTVRMRVPDRTVRDGEPVIVKVRASVTGLDRIRGRLRFVSDDGTVARPWLKQKGSRFVRFALRDLEPGRHRIRVKLIGSTWLAPSRWSAGKVRVLPASNERARLSTDSSYTS